MQAMSHYTRSPLQVEHVGKRDYKLLTPVIWQLEYGDDQVVCYIPAGFVTDYDSTPRWARPFLRGRHLARKAHVLHDFFYNRGWVRVYDETDSPYYDIKMVSRSEADITWRDAMKVERMNSATANVMYQALKAFGFIRWNQCRAKRLRYFKLEQEKHATNTIT